MGAKVLFVCVENSCRSQMAEGFARKLGSGVLEAWSAGSRPSGRVNGTGVAVMKERGIDLGIHRSKGLNDLPQVQWDYIITMGCGDQCPFVAGKAKRDWQIPDPKNLPLDGFRKVRDQVEKQVLDLIKEIKAAQEKDHD